MRSFWRRVSRWLKMTTQYLQKPATKVFYEASIWIGLFGAQHKKQSNIINLKKGRWTWWTHQTSLSIQTVRCGCSGTQASIRNQNPRTSEPISNFTSLDSGLDPHFGWLACDYVGKLCLLCRWALLCVELIRWASTNLESSTLFCLDHVICGESILLSTRHSRVIVWPSDPRTSVLGISITLPEGWNMYRCEHDSQAVLCSQPILL